MIYIIYMYIYAHIYMHIYLYISLYICSQKGRKCGLPVITNRHLHYDNSCTQGFLSRKIEKN